MRLPSTTSIELQPSTSLPRADVEKAARELEAQFAQMLIKSMRSASFGDPLMGKDNSYRDMFDQQMAREISKGRGLGLASTVVRQLESSSAPAPAGTSAPGTFHLPIPGRPSTGAPLPLAVPQPGMMRLDPPSRGAALDLSLNGQGGLSLAPSRGGISMPAMGLPILAPDMIAAAPAPEERLPEAPIDCSSPEVFVKSIWPYAERTAAELGVPAKAIVAQVALETGWGRHLANRDGVTSNNLFGIKASGRWEGQRMGASTHEFVDGVRRSERADFRAYGSTAESFADYAKLLGNPRYAGARNAGGDTHHFASALQKAGYATDPDYAAKITAIANGPTMSRALSDLAVAGGTMIASADTPTAGKG